MVVGEMSMFTKVVWATTEAVSWAVESVPQALGELASPEKDYDESRRRPVIIKLLRSARRC